MRQDFETQIEYFEEISSCETKENEEKSYNRRNVDNIKRMIVCAFVVLCALPVFFCLYLMVKLNNLDEREQELRMEISAQSQQQVYGELNQITESISSNDAYLLDKDAATNLEKEPGESTHVLMGSDDYGDLSSEQSSIYETGNIVEESPTTESGSVSKNSQYKVYLTFDDGPSVHTDEILDVLKANDVKATFFVVYNPDESLWPMYKRIVEEGHTLAMHSYTHVYDDIYYSKLSFAEDVTLIHDFLYQQTGVDCKYYRFPGGSSNSVSDVDIQELIGYLYESGITYYDWNALSEDSVDLSLSPEELNENVMSSVRANKSDTIVLLHDLKDNPNTAAGLQQLIDTIKEEGYQLCPIDDNTIPVQHVTYE